MIGVICDPPREGEPSYETFVKERDSVLADLKMKAKLTSDTLNALEGVTCNDVQGAMYAFPQIRLPPKAIAAAKVCFVETPLLLIIFYQLTGLLIVLISHDYI